MPTVPLADITLSGPVPSLDPANVSTEFAALSAHTRQEIVLECWLKLHCSTETIPSNPASADDITRFTDLLTSTASIRRAAQAAMERAAAQNTPTQTSQSPSSEPSTSTSQPASVSHGTTYSSSSAPTNPTTFDFSTIQPSGVMASGTTASAIRPELREWIAHRSGHAPLTLFLTKSIFDVASNPELLPIEHINARHLDGSIKKRGVPNLKVGDWASSERQMSRSDWTEGFGNYLEALRDGLGTPSHWMYMMWKKYHVGLTGHRLYKSDTTFPSLLEYDIKKRTLWSAGTALEQLAPMSVILTELDHSHADRLSRTVAELSTSLSSRSAAPSYYPSRQSFQSRYQQSSSSTSSSSRPTSSFPRTPPAKPYTRPSGPAPNSSQRPPVICVICRQEHKASECHESLLPNGAPTVSEWSGNGLRTKGTKAPICFFFNLARPEAPAQAHIHAAQGMHICSLCLRSGHGAADCRRA